MGTEQFLYMIRVGHRHEPFIDKIMLIGTLVP